MLRASWVEAKPECNNRHGSKGADSGFCAGAALVMRLVTRRRFRGAVGSVGDRRVDLRDGCHRFMKCTVRVCAAM